MFKFQIQEIENANIKEQEFEQLIEEKKEMSQFEKINENLKTAYTNCVKNGFSESASEQINSAMKNLQNIENVNEHYHELYERMKSCLIELQDIGDTIYDDLNNNVNNEDVVMLEIKELSAEENHILSLFHAIKAEYQEEFLMSVVDCAAEEMKRRRKAF